MKTPLHTLATLCLCGVAACSPVELMHVQKVTANDSFDWRLQGVIPPVRNQGQIGQSIDFVLLDGVESMTAITTKSPIQALSLYEVADCCNIRDRGYDCIAKTGLCKEGDYKRNPGHCASDSCTAVAHVSKTVYVPADRHDLMVKAIHVCPLTAYLNAGMQSFERYVSGIYSDPKCGQRVDHVVTIVGYGSEEGEDYWIIKNSWGPMWGDKGYMKIARGKNMCGIESQAFYPSMDK